MRRIPKIQLCMSSILFSTIIFFGIPVVSTNDLYTVGYEDSSNNSGDNGNSEDISASTVETVSPPTSDNISLSMNHTDIVENDIELDVVENVSKNADIDIIDNPEGKGLEDNPPPEIKNYPSKTNMLSDRTTEKASELNGDSADPGLPSMESVEVDRFDDQMDASPGNMSSDTAKPDLSDQSNVVDRDDDVIVHGSEIVIEATKEESETDTDKKEHSTIMQPDITKDKLPDSDTNMDSNQADHTLLEETGADLSPNPEEDVKTGLNVETEEKTEDAEARLNSEIEQDVQQIQGCYGTWGIYSPRSNAPDMDILYQLFESRVKLNLGIESSIPESLLKESIFPLGMGSPEESLASDQEKDNNSTPDTESVNSSNSNDVNMDFVEGLDDLDKFFEGVDPPDELDVGASGSSMQDMLMQKGKEILTKRFMLGVRFLRQGVETTKGKVLKRLQTTKEKVWAKLTADTDGNIDLKVIAVQVLKTTKTTYDKVVAFIDDLIDGESENGEDLGSFERMTFEEYQQQSN